MDLVFPVVITTSDTDNSHLLGNYHTTSQEELLISALNVLSEKKLSGEFTRSINIYSKDGNIIPKENLSALLADNEFNDFILFDLSSYSTNTNKDNEIFIFSDLSNGEIIFKHLDACIKNDTLSPSSNSALAFSSTETEFRNSCIHSLQKIKDSLITKIEIVRSLLKELPKVLVEKFEKSENIIALINSYQFQYSSLTTANLISLLKSETSSLLAAHVLLDSIKHDGEDPTIGWATVTKTKQNNNIHLVRVENPFSYFNIGEKNQIDSIEYLPRRLLLSHLEPQVAITFNDFKASEIVDLPSRIMRQNPDKFGIRLDQKTPYGVLARTIYINGGLGSFGNHATTGFTVDYWLDEDTKVPNTSLFNLEYAIDLSGSTDSFSARPLLSVGGESKELYRFQNTKNEIVLENIDGGLSGVRVIDGSSHLVIDLRLSYQIRKIKLIKNEFSLNGVSLKISFESLVSQITSDKPIKSLFVSIY